MKRLILGFVAGALIGAAVTAGASDDLAATVRSLTQLLRTITERIDSLEDRVDRMEAGMGSETGASEWTMRTTSHYILHYQKGFEGDSIKIGSFLDMAIERLTAEFSGFELSDVLREIEFEVRLEPKPTDMAFDGRAVTRSGTLDGKVTTYYADLFLLAPSAHQRRCCTGIGEPFDDNYFFKIIVHEYAGIVLDVLHRLKGAGWRLREAPSWYVQGYEEFLALTLSSDHSRMVTLELYKQQLRSNPNRIGLVANDFEVENFYYDGTLIVLFLHETYGKQVVHDFLRSSYDFDRAFREAFNADGKLGERWLAWLESL